eukprot:TRINITY_DN49919_c0_g1_i1.p1 TRINITY_DN49919_c0_g1~~TRINITY_DN49919_c0_g1_i1.p1  ORF type:complete len:442 (+),score=59.15 TRINITY_DN49919_c0_g1_i1:115-1440(+)
MKDASRCHYRVDRPSSPNPNSPNANIGASVNQGVSGKLPPLMGRRSASEATLDSPMKDRQRRNRHEAATAGYGYDRDSVSAGRGCASMAIHHDSRRLPLADHDAMVQTHSPISPERRSSRGKRGKTPTEASTPSAVSSQGFDSPAYSKPDKSAAVAFSGYANAPLVDNINNIKFGYVMGKPIGSGTYGCVFKALEKQTGRIFAIKKANVDCNRSDQDKKYRAKLKEELKICQDLRHPNIVACLGYSCSDMELSIYLEYIAGGSMSALLAEFGPLDNTLLRHATKGLLKGLNYLHTRHPPVVHRDIKGANILVGLDFCVKLADFGCSKRDDLTTSFTTIGSIPWMAPEVIQQKHGHGRKADVWSLGCCIIEMATAEKPWGDKAFENAMYALRMISMSDSTPPVPETMDEIGQDLIGQCIQRDPEIRASVAELLDHTFLLDEL